jgi:hypothetical protein
VGVKTELFSFRGLLVTLLHDVFALGAFSVLVFGVWVGTGRLPGFLTHGKSDSGYLSDERAIGALVDNNPGYDVKLVPQAQKGR